MGIFEDMGVTVDELENELAEDFAGESEEIFRFSVFLSPKREIEIRIEVAQLDIEESPEFCDEYSYLARVYADLIAEHIGIGTESFLDSVAELPELDVELTREEKESLENVLTNENGSVLIYSFYVLLMQQVDDQGKDMGRGLGSGFERSPRAEVMRKMYGEDYIIAEKKYEIRISDAILDHGTLFMKAVEGMRIPE